jgi:flagellar hook-length control protein FliK
MPPMILPPVAPNAGGQPTSSASSAGPRGHGADDARGGFGAALERSRANGPRAKATADASGVATAERKPGRKTDDKDTKEDALADPNLAFLAPPNTPLHALTLAGRAAQTAQGDVAASASAASAAVDAAKAAADKAAMAADVAADPALQDALAKLKPDAAGADAAAGAKAAPDAALAAKDAAKPAADGSARAPATDVAAAAAAAAAAASTETATVPIASLQDVVRAAAAAQTPGVSARPGVSAAGGRAAPRAVSATTAEQLSSATQATQATQTKSAGDTADSVTVTAAAVPAASAAQSGAGATDAQPPATPFALQQPAGVTAQAGGTGGTADASARAPVHTIAPEVGSDKWAPALGQQLARMTAGGQHTAELNLNPAGLGPLKVTLSLGDNQAQAMFVSAHESVRKAVEAALPQLRSSLSEQGITLGQTSVGADTRQPFGNDAAFAQQQQQQQNGPRQQAASYPGAGRAAAAQAAPVAAVRPSPAGNAGAGVDTFA